MAISILDAITYNETASTNTVQEFNYTNKTLTDGQNRMILVCVAKGNNGTTSASFAGVPMTRIEHAQSSGGEVGLDLFYLTDANLPSGTTNNNTLYINRGSTADISMRVLYWSLQGVAQTAPNERANGQPGASLYVSTVNNESWQIYCATSRSASQTPSYTSLTEQSSLTTSISTGIGYTTTATPSNTSGYVTFSSGYQGAILISVSAYTVKKNIAINGYINSANGSGSALNIAYFNNDIKKRIFVGATAHRANITNLGSSIYTNPNTHYFSAETSGSIVAGGSGYNLFTKLFDLSGDSNIIGETGMATAGSACRQAAFGVFSILNSKGVEYIASPVSSTSINVTTYTPNAMVVIIAARNTGNRVSCNGNLIKLIDIGTGTAALEYDRLRLTVAFYIEATPGTRSYSTSSTITEDATITAGASFAPLPFSNGNGVAISPYMVF